MSGVALKSSHYQFQPYFMHGYNGAKRDLEVLRKGFMDVEINVLKSENIRKLIIIFGTIRNSFEKKKHII